MRNITFDIFLKTL